MAIFIVIQCSIQARISGVAVRFAPGESGSIAAYTWALDLMVPRLDVVLRRDRIDGGRVAERASLVVAVEPPAQPN